MDKKIYIMENRTNSPDPISSPSLVSNYKNAQFFITMTS